MEEIKVKYLIEAQDKASKQIEKIDKSISSMKKNMVDADKAMSHIGGSKISNDMKNASKSIDEVKTKYKNMKKEMKNVSFLDSLSHALKYLGKNALYTAAAFLSFKFSDLIILKLKKSLILLKGPLLTLSNYVKNNLTKNFALFSNVATIAIDGLWFSINKTLVYLRRLHNDVKGAISTYTKWGNIIKNDISNGVKSLYKTLTSSKIKNFFQSIGNSIKNINFGEIFSKINAIIEVTKTKIESFYKSFSNINLLSKLKSILNSIISSMRNLGNSIVNSVKSIQIFTSTGEKIKNVAKITKSVSGSFAKAAMHTEVLEKGIFGLAARTAVLAGSFSMLGYSLLHSDKIMARMAGVTLIGLSIAFGGLVMVIRTIIISSGELIQSLGDKLVKALQSSVDKMRKLKDATFTFQFIIQNLNKETHGAIGTFEEWSGVMTELSQKTGYSMKEVQKSVSEMLRFGQSIGLTKNQMQNMLPIIADLAEANHKDLFSSTLAVVEALNGQSMMLQNMGVNLTQHALAETKAGKAVAHHMDKLKNSEKVQIRYNALLEKTATVQGIAEASVNTNAGALRRFNTAMENMSLSVGTGAEIIDTRFNAANAQMLIGLQDLSAPLLKVVGFVGSLMGRVLQVTGFFVKWSFSIVLVTSSISALNIILKNAYISKFLIWLAQTNILTVKLASVFPQASMAIQAFLTKVGVAGLSLKSLNAVMIATAKRSVLIFGKLALAMAPTAATVGAIVGSIYLLYKAFQLIESKTQVFSKIAESFKKWWDMPGLMAKMKDAIADMTDSFVSGLSWAVVKTAQGILSLYTAFLKLKGGVILISQAISEAWDLVIDKMVSLKDKTLAMVKGLPSKMLSLVGINSAWADSLEITAVKTEKVKNKTNELSKADKKALKGIQEQIKANQELSKSLAMVNNTKVKKEESKSNSENIQAQYEEELTLMQAFNEAKIQMKINDRELEKIQEELNMQEDYQLLVKAYGQKEAARKVYEVKKQIDEAKKHKEEIDRIKAKNAAILGLSKNVTDAKRKIEVDGIKKAEKEKDAVRQWGYKSASNFLRAGMLLAKQGSVEMKALATAEAVINTWRAAAQALADPMLPYFMKPIAVASTIALGMAQVYKINSAKSYYTGGIIEGASTGDQVQVNANGGEMIINKSQQRELYNIAQGNNTSDNSNNLVEAINNLISAALSQDIVVNIDEKEVARAVRNQVASGYAIA